MKFFKTIALYKINAVVVQSNLSGNSEIYAKI